MLWNNIKLNKIKNGGLGDDDDDDDDNDDDDDDLYLFI